jgi:hypothetical protein
MLILCLSVNPTNKNWLTGKPTNQNHDNTSMQGNSKSLTQSTDVYDDSFESLNWCVNRFCCHDYQRSTGRSVRNRGRVYKPVNFNDRTSQPSYIDYFVIETKPHRLEEMLKKDYKNREGDRIASKDLRNYAAGTGKDDRSLGRELDRIYLR